MTEPERTWHPYGRTREEDLQILADGGHTGWWDDTGNNTGIPAPWPEDFLNPQAGWTTANPNNPNENQPDHDPKNPPY